MKDRSNGVRMPAGGRGGDRFGHRLVDVGRGIPQQNLVKDVRRGLGSPGQRSLPPAWFYDRTGSALFEAITELAEYYPTRTESALLAEHASDILTLSRARQLVELGSGSSTKTRVFFQALKGRPLTYIPIDVSPTMLEATAARLGSEFPSLEICGLIGRYEDALAQLPPHPDRLVLFLGSTIGNFTEDERETFFRALAGQMTIGNNLLVGYDCRAHAGKPAEVIARAYNDDAGVTARFNLNLLVRLNRELGADFDLSCWAHHAIYNPEASRIEMYLVSLADQIVTIPALPARYRFQNGERLLTELSYKFASAELAAWFPGIGLVPVQCWEDAHGYCGLMLLTRAGDVPPKRYAVTTPRNVP